MPPRPQQSEPLVAQRGKLRKEPKALFPREIMYNLFPSLSQRFVNLFQGHPFQEYAIPVVSVLLQRQAQGYLSLLAWLTFGQGQALQKRSPIALGALPTGPDRYILWVPCLGRPSPVERIRPRYQGETRYSLKSFGDFCTLRYAAECIGFVVYCASIMLVV